MVTSLIDTHCHLDDPVFADDFQEVLHRAQQASVGPIVIPAVEVRSFDRTIACAHAFEDGFYALGIHPLYVPQAQPNDLQILEEYLRNYQDDPRLVAVGEIGLDFFVPELNQEPLKAKQLRFYHEQLKLAQRYKLPVLLHVRRAQDLILKYARRFPQVVGIAHAFNGSFQQAERFLAAGFKLGVGGAMTFTRARQIRRLVTQLPMESFVLETDAPDIPPAWLSADIGQVPRNEPFHLERIAMTLAELRAQPLAQIIQRTTENALTVLPRLQTASCL